MHRWEPYMGNENLDGLRRCILYNLETKVDALEMN